MTTYFVDYEGGNDANSGLSFALRKKLFSSFSPAAGDTVRIMASPAPTSLAQNATWTHASATVTLTTAVTAMISDCQTTWTASSNVTCTDNTTNFKESTKSQQIAVAAGFATGLAAYFTTGLLNLAAYQQVTFWIRQTAGTVTIAGDVSLRLCSDTVGAVSVQTIAIPALVANGQWIPITIDTSGALPAVVNSIALYVDTDRGAVTFLLDDIQACKASASADSLSLTSLLGYSDSTGAGGSELETWYGIASINGTSIKLDNGVNTNAAAGRGWSGRVRAIESSTNATPIVITATAHGLVTGDVIELRGHQTNTAANGAWTITKIGANTFSLDTSVGNGVGVATGGFWPTTQIRTTWKRETTPTTMVAASATDVQTIPASGSAGSAITYSGGWNRTDMSTQTDETWFDGRNGLGKGLDFLSTTYIAVSKLAVTRYGTGVDIGSSTASNLVVSLQGVNNCTNGISNAGSVITAVTLSSVAVNNNSTGVGVGTAAVGLTITITTVSNNLSTAFANTSNAIIALGSVNNNFGTGVNPGVGSIGTVIGAVSNTTVGLNCAAYSSMTATILANNGTFGAAINVSFAIAKINTYGNTTAGVSVSTGTSFLHDSYIAESTRVATFTTTQSAQLYSKNDQQVAGAFRIYADGCTVDSETSVVHTAGTSWKVSPISTNRGSGYKFALTLARFTVVSGLTYTVKCWIRRDEVTTLNAGLLIRGGFINGITNDITVTASGSINTYTQETLATFTPTESGTIELIGQVWDGTGITSNAYFDDVTVNNGTTTNAITMDYTDFRNGPGSEPQASTNNGTGSSGSSSGGRGGRISSPIGRVR